MPHQPEYRKQRADGQEEPRYAPGFGPEDWKKEATSEEIAQGEATPVTSFVIERERDEEASS
ncbi:hypothetical protein J31TS4_14130 [Paenibacillus sp. J31TS4]|uniref:hypothetical protein n=1 Tax=Paenibacillus sp. J31TS4 TaxID=2807195 RepID=UPI001AFCDFB4|nr:hypothetical protein [Paenibacillus sp. J31TS4]GIP38133.1 hypothetical protein J31TS4_14130 [Paenibacillus sp. J31TS4]